MSDAEDSYMDVAWLTLLLEGYLLTAVGLVGLVGNVMAILIFSRQLVQRNFHALMVTLSVFDSLYIVVSVLVFAAPQFFKGKRKQKL